MSEKPVSVSTEGLHVASEQATKWEQAVERAGRGETVAVLAHGQHVADVVPSGEIERLRETIEVLSDHDLLRDLRAGLADIRAGRVEPAQAVAVDLERRSAPQ
ncbi:MAG: hypothetical protein ACRDRG_11835 [Pseudonocardiaceae bacterium]